MSSMIESDELVALRAAVSALGHRHGPGFDRAALWAEAGKLGYLGVNLPRSTAAGAAAWPSCRSSSKRRARRARRS